MAEPFDTPVVDAEITDDDKLWALLSWITGIAAVIALLMEDKKERAFVKYNAVMSLVVWVVLGLVAGIISAITCGLGFISFVVYVYPIYLGIKAYQGQWVEVPVVSNFVQQQGWASKP